MGGVWSRRHRPGKRVKPGDPTQQCYPSSSSGLPPLPVLQLIFLVLDLMQVLGKQGQTQVGVSGWFPTLDQGEVSPTCSLCLRQD